MDVHFLLGEPFPGWMLFRESLLRADPMVLVPLVQRFICETTNLQDGAFRGVSPVFPTNVHVVMRELVLELRSPYLPPDEIHDVDTITRILTKACRQVTDLRENHPALGQGIVLTGTLADEQRLRSLWFQHLEQLGSSWAPKLELGRSQRMYAEIWPELVQRGSIKLTTHGSSAYRCLDYACLLSLVVFAQEGFIPDVREAVADWKLSNEALSTLLALYAIPLEKAQLDLASSDRYPTSIQNYFQRYPLLRIDDWCLLAPLPHLILQGWGLRNLFEALDDCLANDPESGGRAFYRAFGLVVEAYVNDLLAELAQLTGCNHLPSFTYGCPEVASPDAFLQAGGVTLVVESKCYRIPQEAYSASSLDGFLAWFSDLLGHNKKDRLPLCQGKAFFDSWRTGQADLCERLGPYRHDTLYLIVSYDDVPLFSNWRTFKQWYGEHALTDETRGLWKTATIASVRCLESFVAAARSEVAAGRAFDPLGVISQYVQYCRTAPDVTAQPPSFKETLGNWCLTTFPESTSFEPETIRAARKRLEQGILEAAYGAL